MQSIDVARCRLPTRRGVTGGGGCCRAQVAIDGASECLDPGGRILPGLTRSICGCAYRLPVGKHAGGYTVTDSSYGDGPGAPRSTLPMSNAEACFSVECPAGR